MIRLSVRQLVERVLRSGDIDGGYVSRDRMLEGAAAHRILQKINKKTLDEYESEVTLRAVIPCSSLEYHLEGRADGLFVQDGMVLVDEIKTTVIPVSRLKEDMEPIHWAQGKCYAYIDALENSLEQIGVQLTYYNIESRETVRYVKEYSFQELESFVMDLLERYSVWARLQMDWELKRDSSIKELDFPFDRYRKGQRELAVASYKTICQKKKLFALAPTGTGKTISVLYPSIKALAEKEIGKIFYLTAKTISRQAPLEALWLMKKNGLALKGVVLTAKDKICFCEETLCNPGYCSYAKGHFDRVDQALLDGLSNEDVFTRTTVEAYAQKHKVCPFEFSLDLALFVDLVVCDYNYVFDPRAYLRRFFAAGQADGAFLIDEAHNLVDRGREMFSAETAKSSFFELKKAWKGKDKELECILGKINKEMLALGKACTQEGFFAQKALPEILVTLLTRFVGQCEWMLKERKDLREDDGFLQQYFQALGFLSISDLYDEDFITFCEKKGKEIIVKLLCLDPSTQLQAACERGKSSIFFSATLSPMQYYKSVLGGEDTDWHMSLDSPFDQDRFCLLAADGVSTKYHKREETKSLISRMIHEAISARKGNYMVYFPSYRYMEAVFEDFTSNYPLVRTVMQQQGLSEEGREEFLDLFSDDMEESLIGFCVLGGIFSEGIDLKGDKLIGAVIVSVGLPQINVQQNLLKDHFEEKYASGFEFAYMYPGMNKVMQAVGRVIRSEQDKGMVLLIDERYGHRNYRQLFPKHWQGCRYVGSPGEVQERLDEFWKDSRKVKENGGF